MIVLVQLVINRATVLKNRVTSDQPLSDQDFGPSQRAKFGESYLPETAKTRSS